MGHGWGFPFQLIGDNAGGHGWSKNDNIFNVHAKMMLDDFGITLLRQPPQSPDLNIWDQHLWRAWDEDLAVLPKGKKATKEQVAAAVIEIYKNMSRYTCLFGIEKVQFSQRELVKHGGSPVASDTAKHRDIDALLEQRWGSAAVQLAKTQGPPPEADIGGQCTGRPVSAMPRPGREAAEVDSVDYLL